MLDIYARDAAGQFAPLARGADFCRIELSPLDDGKVFVSLISTTVDDEEPQLLDCEIARERVATIDDLVALIRTHVRIAPSLSPAARH